MKNLNQKTASSWCFNFQYKTNILLEFKEIQIVTYAPYTMRNELPLGKKKREMGRLQSRKELPGFTRYFPLKEIARATPRNLLESQ